MDIFGTSRKSAEHSSKVNICTAGVTIALTLLPVMAFFSPRLMAYAPSLIAFIGIGAGFFLLGRRPVWPKATILWAAGIACLAGASSLWSIDPGFTLERTLKMVLVLGPGILLLALVLSLDSARVKPFLWLLPLSVGLAAIFNSTELFFDMPFYRLTRGLTLADSFSHAGANRSIFCTTVAFFVCIPIIQNLGIEKNYRRIALGILSGLIVLMLSLSESQSSQLCFVVGLFFFFVFPYRRKSAWIFIAFVLAALILSAPWTTQIMFKMLAASAGDVPWLAQGYATNRMEIWDFIARYILHSPLYGYGIEATRHIEDFDTQRIYHPDSMVLHPHNFALQLWIEFGLIGALVGSSFLAYLLYRIYRLPLEAARIALPTLFCFISVAATGYGMWQSWWLGDILYMLSLAMLIMRVYHRA